MPPLERFTAPEYLREATYGDTRLPVERASTLIPEAYRSSAYFELEQQQVFARSWVAVGYAERVREPGDVLVARVAGQPIMVVRDGDGVLRAFHNVCRHRGAKLVGEDCRLKRFRCSYHSWTYALDGAVLGTPLFEGSPIPEDQQALFDMGHVPSFDKGDYGLLPVSVDLFGHLVLVNLDPEAVPLATWLGDLPERLAGYRLEEATVRVERDYDVAADWKLVAENFMEYYHLPWVHPELVKVSRIEDHHRFQGPGMYTGMCTNPISRDERSDWSDLPAVPGLSDDDASSGRFVVLFPNVALAVLPNHVFTMIVEPSGPGRTRERTSLALPPQSADDPELGPALATLADFWDHVNREDIEVIEAVQEGLTSTAYTGGRMCYRFEEPLHRFQNMVVDRMVGIERVPAGDERPLLADRFS